MSDATRLRCCRPLLGALLAAVLAPDARAQVQLDRYSAPVVPDDGVSLSRPIGIGKGRVAGLLALDYADDPLVLELESGLDDTETTSLVHSQVEAHGRIAYGLLDNLVLSLGLDAALVMAGDGYADPATGATLAPADGSGLGDARIGARYIALGDAESLTALGIEGVVTLPLARGTNSDQNLSGESSVTLQPRALGEIRPGRFRVTGNLGALVRENERMMGATLGDDLTFGLGAGMKLPGRLRRFELMLEMYGSTAFADIFARASTPLEALAGGRWKPTDRWLVSLAGGTGIQRGIGSPDLRAIASLGFVGVEDDDSDGDGVLQADDRCPAEAEDRDGVEDIDGCPDADDSDGDGVFDSSDACPRVPEDRDGWSDADGCLDADNDADGLADGTDRCPDQAEDLDGFEDDDGCPEGDNDADGTADATDACPAQAEDVDTFQDEDGCPDPDNDGDGVPDANDACALEPGSAEAKGCPAVQLSAGRIEIRERIEFQPESDVLAADSEAILQQMRALLEQHPEIRSVAIEGHTDSSGRAALNQSLSERRAARVVSWLVEHGVAPDRLTAWGCAASRPLADDATDDGRQRNRRVEAIVLDPAPESVPDRSACRQVPMRAAPPR
jgi:outer membrane protein OmpA-like peptidoglycan-associated protein